MRKITVLSTLVGNKQITSDATTFEGIHADLEKIGITINQFKFVVGQTKGTLELPSAELPSGDFTLVVTPLKTKAGSLTYAEMKAFIRDERNKAEENGDNDLLDIILDYGNYIQLNATRMEELYNEVKEYLDDTQLDFEECDCSEVIEELQSDVERLKERLTAVEIANNILTEENADEFFEAKQQEVADVIKEINNL